MSKTTFSTRNAAGKNFEVTYWGGESVEFPRGHWQVTITNSETETQDHGNFCLQSDRITFALEGCENTDTDDVIMIQNEIAADLRNNGELRDEGADLVNSDTGDVIREATTCEIRESAFVPSGHIEVNGVRCWVDISEREAEKIRKSVHVS